MPARSRSASTSTTAGWKEAQRSATSWSLSGAMLLGRQPQRGLQAGEGEVQLGAAVQRPRQREARADRRAPPLLDLRPAGIAQAEQLGGLVEGFAERVVDGGAERA